MSTRGGPDNTGQNPIPTVETLDAGANPSTSNPLPPETGGANGKRKGGAARRLMAPAIVVLIVIGGALGFFFWYSGSFYISTENASITGNLIQVGTLNAGRLDSLAVDVGSRIEKNQVIATVALPSAVGSTQGVAKVGFLGTGDLSTEVRSPVSGVVVARASSVGGTLAAGQSIVTVVDPNDLWVVANIEETKISQLHVDQRVEVHVDALDKSFAGRIRTITPATTSTFSLLPTSNGSGNFTKTTLLMPVKIAVDTQGNTLPLGGSVEVKIKLGAPGGILSWLP